AVKAKHEGVNAGVSRAGSPSPTTRCAGTRPLTLSPLAGVALGLSVTAKSFTLVYLPLLVRWSGSRSARVRLCLATIGMMALFYLPLLLTGVTLQGGAQRMAEYWDANGSLYKGIHQLLDAT